MKSLKKYLLPILLFLVAIGGYMLDSFILNMSPELERLTSKLAGTLLITSIAWAIIVTIKVAKKIFMGRIDITTEDNLESRKLFTQFNIIERVLIFIIIILSIGVILMQFESIKKIGTGIFASAGVAGIILGLAAQKVFGSILAGLQIAFTQPIRVDDVVIVEGEWGWIEEITITYVVVRIWDKRRLIVPCSYFIEKPFQNWTRTTAEILGTVFIYTDYSVDFDALRAELTRLLESTDMWDKQVNVLQVTDAKENRVEVRALMSARNSPTAWDLRVYVRENLLKFLQREFPDSLPKTRIYIENDKPKEKEIEDTEKDTSRESKISDKLDVPKEKEAN
ncbi:mechanosensitive ion channel family protein [Zhouia sp. PK063]|uniref:mechanosensitive ion channel family protein n=1 Tax=Zhouia sp. PK063 TaxID=3373602 RepID=UPI00379B6E9E